MAEMVNKIICDILTKIPIFSVQNIELNGTHIVIAYVWSGLTINVG